MVNGSCEFKCSANPFIDPNPMCSHSDHVTIYLWLKVLFHTLRIQHVMIAEKHTMWPKTKSPEILKLVITIKMIIPGVLIYCYCHRHGKHFFPFCLSLECGGSPRRSNGPSVKQ
jgi:hypothetical protein